VLDAKLGLDLPLLRIRTICGLVPRTAEARTVM
jgi:hypothetical protein